MMQSGFFLNIFSSVGGGPHERLAKALRDLGADAKTHAAFTPESYREHFKNGSISRLTTRLASFALTPVLAFAQALRASCAGAAAHQKPIAVATTNPFFLPHFLVATRMLHRCAVVALMYDLYPDALEAAGMNKPLISKLMTAANRAMIRHADGVVHIGQKLRANAEARCGVNPKTATIPTGGDKSEFSALHNALPREFADWAKDRTIFSYVGNMGRMHDSETFKIAIPRFIDGLSPEDRAKVGFVFAASGPGIADLRAAWATRRDDCIRIIDPLPDDAWADLLMITDVALASLAPNACAASIPSKVQSAMAAGCIPLAVCPAGSDLAQLVRCGSPDGSPAGASQLPCGIVVDPGDVGACEASFRRLAFEDRSALKEAVGNAADRLDMTAVARRWRDFLGDVAQNAPIPWREAAYRAAKRSFDFCASLAGLIVLSPVMAATAIGVYCRLGSPVIFCQQRPGRGEKPFNLYKFRSMKPAPGNAPADAAKDGERLTPFGKKIRALSLDELPTLFNVLKGDMSLVGPRPLLMSYLPRYSAEQRKRHLVRPGITGLAQINGRNALSWEEKFKYDVEYAENASILLDIEILFKTVRVVLRRSGIAHANSETMPEFMGSDPLPNA